MTWEELTNEQRDVIVTLERDNRGLMGELQRWINKAIAQASRYDGQMAIIMNDLAPNTIVPNTSGLAGSSALNVTTEFVGTFIADMKAIITTYNTPLKQQLRAKAAGQANV